MTSAAAPLITENVRETLPSFLPWLSCSTLPLFATDELSAVTTITRNDWPGCAAAAARSALEATGFAPA